MQRLPIHPHGLPAAEGRQGRGMLRFLTAAALLLMSALHLPAQRLESHGTFLLSASRDTVPAGEVWKVVGSFGAPAAAIDPADTAALAKHYRDMYNLRLENIHPQNLKGGMVMKDVLPLWLAEGSVFSSDPGDLMELFVERYRIVRE